MILSRFDESSTCQNVITLILFWPCLNGLSIGKKKAEVWQLKGRHQTAGSLGTSKTGAAWSGRRGETFTLK